MSKLACPHCRQVVDCTHLTGVVVCPRCSQRFSVAAPTRPVSAHVVPPPLPTPPPVPPPLPAAETPLVVNTGVSSSRTLPRPQRGRGPSLVLIIAGAVVGLLAIASLGGYFLYSTAPERRILGVWQFEKEVGGPFAEENNKGSKVSVEFLAGGKMVMHNWRESLDGKWEIDRTASPPQFRFNWMSGDRLDEFDAIEFPTRDTMVIRTQIVKFTMDAQGAMTEEDGADVFFHFRRRRTRPKPHSAARIQEIEALIAEQEELSVRLSSAPPHQQRKLKSELDALEFKIGKLKQR